MAEDQRIHPVDVEAPARPSAPLVPRELAKSENGDPTAAHYSPPFPTTTPAQQQQQQPKKKRRSCCCKCFCWTTLTVVVLILLIAATVGILYLVFHPKIPKYSVDSLRVANFTVSNSTLHATFDLNITTHNPNKKIGIYYRPGSNLSVGFAGNTLVTGSFPVFYQGHRNTTVVTVVLTGEQAIDGGVIQELQSQQQTGSVPLDFRGVVPVKLKLGSLKLWTIKFRVKCRLDVDRLTANNRIGIKRSSCKFRLKELFA